MLHEPDVLPENVYNIDESRVMLSMLNSVKVLVGKDHIRGYRGARVKRTIVTAVECIADHIQSLSVRATKSAGNMSTKNQPAVTMFVKCCLVNIRA